MELETTEAEKLIKKIINDGNIQLMKIISKANISDLLLILLLIDFICSEEPERFDEWIKHLLCILLNNQGKKIDLSNNGIKLLYYSVDVDNIPYVEYLLKNNVNVDDIDYKVICLALRRSNLKMVKYLVEEDGYKNASVNSRKNYQLICALESGDIEIIKYLVSKGAKVDGSNDSEIFNAIKKGFPQLSKYLIGKKTAQEAVNTLIKVIDQLVNDI